MLEIVRRRWFSSTPMTPKRPAPRGRGSLSRLARDLNNLLNLTDKEAT